MQQAFPLYKLMILEMLNKANFPLTNSQITEFLVTYNYVTYFEVQQTFSELSASGLIVMEQIHHSTRYSLTEEGEQTLSYYRHMLPDSFIENTQSYFQKNKIKLRNTNSVIAGYMPSSNGDYVVQCRIMEKGRSIFDMTMPAPTTEIAEQMCFNFEKKQAELYSHILLELTGGQ